VDRGKAEFVTDEIVSRAFSSARARFAVEGEPNRLSLRSDAFLGEQGKVALKSYVFFGLPNAVASLVRLVFFLPRIQTCPKKLRSAGANQALAQKLFFF